MSGPFALKYLHLFLREKTIGAFILSRNGRSADLVGASEDDLAAAIRRCARDSNYRYVWFAHTASSSEAHALEFTWYHRYHPTDNASAPSKAHGKDWQCTREGCAACALTGMRA
ncbi:MAG TPA: hypothetical protein VJ692_05670 [Nitrospiraceae bacterium]|nr:hypothetical protein [Nitrospiraceae bacterium]